MSTRGVVALVGVLALWLVVVLAGTAAWGSSPCVRTDGTAFRMFAEKARTYTVDRQARDLVRQAVIRDYLACQR